jgi:hypothetical protein
MKMPAFPRPGLESKALCLLAAALALAVPASAGVVDGVRAVDGLTVYLGVVPAAVTRGHPAGHIERTMHDGAARSGNHDVHLLVALFNSASGERVRNASLTARIHAGGRTLGTVPLSPMRVNGALTYGGYASIGLVDDIMIAIDIRRPGRTPRTGTVTARFDYVHD